jgi:hypothetical protein
LAPYLFILATDVLGYMMANLAPARTKVKWDTLALPTAQGGLGVTDPKSQSETLLAKLLVRGLSPNGEPWKELVMHKANQTKLLVHGKGPTNPNFNWLFAAPKLKRLQCSMWKNIVGAWLNVRSGLTKSDPTTTAEMLRQPLFGNLSILNTNGTPFGVNGLSEGCAFAHSECSQVKDLWSPENKKWKGLLNLGMSHHTSNRRCRNIITASIPWRPDEYNSHIQVSDWISSPTPGMGNPLDWVYLVLEHTRDKASVIEFKKITINDRIQAMTQQALMISTANYRTVRILSQQKPGATLKVAKDPPAPGKKPPLTRFLKHGSSRISF